MNNKNLNFPIYIGPIFDNTKIVQFKVSDLNIRAFKKNNKYYWFNIKNSSDSYINKLIKIREYLNLVNDRKKHLDLPIFKIDSLIELLEIQKNYRNKKYDGYVYINAYKEDAKFNFIKFKEQLDERD